MNGGGRITGEDTSYWSVCLGLVAVILLGSTVYYVATYKSQHKKTDPYDFNKPVPSDSELRIQLKEEQYKVTRQNGTEAAFQNDYWNNDKLGLYVDIITGDPLFSSLDKFDAQNGRPNFGKPLPTAKLVQRPDPTRPDLQRTEVRTARSDSHLGFLSHDGPPPTAERYTVNSAALKFVPVDKMEAEGYAQWRSLFPNASPTPTPGR
jgi:peptide-methionine (R)-S-oxide reductase